MDFIDDRAIASVGIPFKVLVLPEVERIPVETYLKIVDFAATGGIVIAEGHAPTLDANSTPARIPQISSGLFEGGRGHLVKDVATLGATLKPLVQPDFQVANNQSDIGVVHRKLEVGDLYFVANTSNQAIHTMATVRVSGPRPQWWDPMSGNAYSAADATTLANGYGVPLELAPYESRLLVFAPEPDDHAPALPGRAAGTPIDLSSDWNLSMAGHAEPAIHMDKLHSWADDPKLKFYSGEMDYRKNVDIPAAFLQGREVVLDFGEGTPIPDPHRTGPGMRALLESPVHEAAVVNINGQQAGTIWHPPYKLDVTKFLHPGQNQISIVVGNLALNQMAGQPLPNYKLLNIRYGERFQAQDMDQVQSMPSGLTGPVRLVPR